MKKVILWIILLILLIATIPITAGIKQDVISKETAKSETAANTVIKLNDDEQEVVISNVMEYITEDYNTECKKAIVALCKNNVLVQKSKGLELKETEVSKYSDSFRDELMEILNEDDTRILLRGERVYIPIVNLCPGFIVEDAEYPYISSVACPWDTQSAQYIKGFDYPCGISVNGINSLCTLGFESKYVLSYFLPQFSIN